MSEGLFGRLQSEIRRGEITRALHARCDETARACRIAWRSGCCARSRRPPKRSPAFWVAMPRKPGAIIADWLEKGYLREAAADDQIYYVLRTAPKRPREIPLDLWTALQKKVEK